MKTLLKIFLTIGAAFLVSCTTSAEDENDDFDAAKVCPVSGRGTFTDERDGQVYKYTTIGNQVWMAENLRYDAEYSECFDRVKNQNNEWIEKFCDTYGRFYSLQYEGLYMEKLNDSLVSVICPREWHLPSVEEWKRMTEFIGPMELDLTSRRLRGPGYTFGEEGTDECSFTVLPAGAYMGEKLGVAYYHSDAIFGTSTVDSLGKIKTIKIGGEVAIFNNLPKMSIRCVKD